ncbi:MAG TPA: hypothetical protein VMB52_05005 [Verrucomicrobiae bacterium]|nr:hypothetical protein [Verrucomicrobiae bacterium]
MDQQAPQDDIPLLKRKMTRKQFIGTVAGGMLSAIGIFRIIEDVNEHVHVNSVGSYGDGFYGGTTPKGTDTYTD